MARKRWDELDLMDNELMNIVASDPNVGIPFCKCVLSVLLEKKIENIRVNVQRYIPGVDSGKRGVCLDVEVEEEEIQDGTKRVIEVFDLFGEEQRLYTFQQRCLEVPEIPYEDGLRILYFNTKGTRGGSQSVQNMLNYLQESKAASVVDEATREIDGYVRGVKENPKAESVAEFEKRMKEME